MVASHGKCSNFSGQVHNFVRIRAFANEITHENHTIAAVLHIHLPQQRAERRAEWLMQSRVLSRSFTVSQS